MWNGSQLFGGEITVYPAGGYRDVSNAVAAETILQGWKLTDSDFLTTKQRGWKKLYAAALRQRLANLTKIAGVYLINS